MSQKYIVVVDGAWAGHHAIYVKTFAKVLLEAGYEVSVLCPAPQEMAAWFSQTIAPGGGKFAAYEFSDCAVALPGFLPGRVRELLTRTANWLRIAAALKKIHFSRGAPDMVFFAYVDSFLSAYVPVWLVDWKFLCGWSGLYFSPRRHGNRPAPENLVVKSKRACSLAILDAGVAHQLQSRLGDKRVCVFPDFSDEVPACDDLHLAEEIRRRARGRKIIGLLGGLARRKGLLTLLRLARQPAAQDWYFVFAGRLLEQTFTEPEREEIRQFFEQPRDNCFARLDNIPGDAQFNALVEVCDVVFAVYHDFLHSSNLVTKAAAYAKPVLVSSGGYMEEVVRQYGLGEVVAAGDVHAALASLSRMAADGYARERAAGMRAYSAEQSQNKLRQALLDLVERCGGTAA